MIRQFQNAQYCEEKEMSQLDRKGTQAAGLSTYCRPVRQSSALNDAFSVFGGQALISRRGILIQGAAREESKCLGLQEKRAARSCRDRHTTTDRASVATRIEDPQTLEENGPWADQRATTIQGNVREEIH